MEFFGGLIPAGTGLLAIVIGLLVFGGMGRIAFWRERDGMRVGGMLATGLALLLTCALLTWAAQYALTIAALGPWAALILLEAILILALNSRRRTKNME